MQAAIDVVVHLIVRRPDPLSVSADEAEAAAVDGSHLAIVVTPRADTVQAELARRLSGAVVEVHVVIGAAARVAEDAVRSFDRASSSSPKSNFTVEQTLFGTSIDPLTRSCVEPSGCLH